MTTTEDTDRLPQGMQLTPLDDDYRKDPYVVLKSLRDLSPVHEDQEMGRVFVHEAC
jgi:hypothetical protein